MSVSDNSNIMTKLNSYLNDKFYFFYVTSCMIIIPVSEFLAEIIFEYVYYIQPLILSFYGYIGICVILISLCAKYLEHRLFHWSDLFVTTLLFFAAVSLIFSSNISISVNIGNRMIEEPSHYLAYYSLMFSAFQIKSDKYRKKILYVFLALSFFNGIIGILQTFDIRLLPSRSDPTNKVQVYGLTQNRNYFGGLSVLFVGAVSGLFIYNTRNEKKCNIILIVLFIITFYCSFNSVSRLAWVGDIGVYIFILISIIIMMNKVPREKLYFSMIKKCGFVIALSVFIVFISILKTDIILGKIEATRNEVSNDDLDRIGSGRGYIWRCCLESVPRHWATGTGLSNIITCFEEHDELLPSDEKKGAVSIRAHNDYIQVLITQGVFSFLNYMLLLIISVKCAVLRIINTDDESDRLITWVCLTMFTGYLIQGLFNCSVINVAMYFWIVVGLMNPNDRSKIKYKKAIPSKNEI